MRSLLVITLFLTTISVRSQDAFSISGTVSDSIGRLVSVGDVLLYAVGSDSLLRYTTVSDGRFSLDAVSKGKYRLHISCMGFTVAERVLELQADLVLKIKLKESVTALDEVAVMAAKPILTNTNGNLKIDVTNQIFTTMQDPMEVLSKLPGVQLSPDRERVTVLGKGSPLVYVGNQRISSEELKALSVNDIASIEIVKNPSAKYEANGRAVILITRRLNTDGSKLNLSENVSFRRNPNKYTNLNGSYQKKKLTLKGNVAYNDLQTWEIHTFKFEIPEADILSDYLVLIDKNNRRQVNFGGGIFYKINEDDYISANLSARLQKDEFTIDTDTFLRRGNQEDLIITETGNNNTKDFLSGNLNYSKKPNEKTNLFTGMQYSTFTQGLNTDIANSLNATEFLGSQERQQKYRIQVLAFRLDVEHHLRKELKWEIGTNVSAARANALTDIKFLESDTDLNIDYDYKERNMAGYSQLSGKLAKGLNFNAGLRIENNRVRGEVQDGDIPLVDREKTNLFPKGMLSVQLDSLKSLTFDYGQSIGRPNYANASSISAFINPFLEGEGNVNLLPTTTEDFSATFQFKKNSISLAYSRRKNPIYYTIGYTSGAETAIFSLKNLTKETGVDLSVVVPVTKGIWSSSTQAVLSARRISDATAQINASKPYLYLYTDHQFKIGEKTTISVGGWGFTKRSEGIFKRNAMTVWNAGIATTFFKKLNCAIRFNDMTGAMNFGERYSINGVNADGVYFADGREFILSLKYNLGKSKDPRYMNKEIDENLNRIR